MIGFTVVSPWVRRVTDGSACGEVVELYERKGWRDEDIELRVICILLGSWNPVSYRRWPD